MQFNNVTQYNNTFMSPNSSLPICGHNLRDMYLNKLVQAKVNIPILVPAMPVKVSNLSTKSNAGTGLNPNVLSVDMIAAATTEISGFSIASPTDFLLPGDEAPAARETQIAYVMLLGCGEDVYLPCDSSLAGVQLDGILIDYDFTTNCLKKSAGAAALPIKIKGPVVDGITYQTSNVNGSTPVKMVKTKCVRVQL